MPERSLAHLPVTLFASVMGLGGVALAWRRAAQVWNLPTWPFLVFLSLAVIVFVVLAIAYVVKWVRYPDAVRAELRHPIRMAFVPTVTIGVLLIATATSGLAPGVATVLWWIGALGHLALTAVILSAWFRRQDIGTSQITPAWFIPVVGNVVTPLATPAVGNLDVAWFSFGVGLVFYIAFLPLVMHRVLLHEPALPATLLPTLAVFVAPPAVGLLSWQALTGQLLDPFGQVLFAGAVFLSVLVLLQMPLLARTPFALPYWAYVFPAAAMATAAVAVAGERPQPVCLGLAAVLLTGATLGALAVVALTLRAAVQGRICIPES